MTADLPLSVQHRLAEASQLEGRGRLEEAARLFEEVAAAYPARHDVTHQAGVVAFKRDRLAEAAELMERAIAVHGAAHYHRNLCEVYRRLGRLDEAVLHGRRATALAPGDASARYNLGVALYDRLEMEAAISVLREAVALAPDHAEAHFELAEALLISGRFEEGWREYEWRLRAPGGPRLAPPGDRPRWDGGRVGGKLLLIADQGFGDAVQFARYLPQAAQRCSDLVVIGDPRLKDVIEAVPGVALYTSRWADAEPCEAFAVFSSLPGLFGVRLETLPSPEPYLSSDPARAAAWRERLDAQVPAGLKRIGLVWAGRPTHGNDANRSIPLERLAPLGAVDGVALIALQLGPARDRLARFRSLAPVVDLGGEIADFADTAAILHGLDGLVSVDTSVAHLAGAMGRPVELLLPYAPDWRWLLNRADTPWYPAVTLHRQPAPGAWDEPIAAVARRLAAGA